MHFFLQGVSGMGLTVIDSIYRLDGMLLYEHACGFMIITILFSLFVFASCEALYHCQFLEFGYTNGQFQGV